MSCRREVLFILKIVDEVTYDMDNIRDKWDFDTELTHDEYDAIICGFESERESAQ